MPTPEEFDAKKYASLSPEEKGKYVAALFVQTLNANVKNRTPTP